MPVIAGHFIRIGLLGALTASIVLVVDALIYYPFFKKADKLALAEEQAEEAEQEVVSKEKTLQPEN